MAILVTGGAGYIGSHTALALMERGYDVVILDNLCTGRREFVDVLSAQTLAGRLDGFVEGDMLDAGALSEAFGGHRIDAVVHLASLSIVSESVDDPDRYRRNNVQGAKCLLDAMSQNGCRCIVVSSSASVYGDPGEKAVKEECQCSPVNPYGDTKLAVEEMVRRYGPDNGIRGALLRYFNVIGADPGGRLGEWREKETHLVPVMMDKILSGDGLEINGSDYETPDGTCIRDYVDVTDVACANVLALEYLLNGGPTECFNIGTSVGLSVMDVVKSAEDALGVKIGSKVAGRRRGDPAVLVADIARSKEVLGWQPRRSLAESLNSAYNWAAGRRADGTHAGLSRGPHPQSPGSSVRRNPADTSRNVPACFVKCSQRAFAYYISKECTHRAIWQDVGFEANPRRFPLLQIHRVHRSRAGASRRRVPAGRRDCAGEDHDLRAEGCRVLQD